MLLNGWGIIFTSQFEQKTLMPCIVIQLLQMSGLQGTSFRIGQISGGLPNGAWSTTDWIPSLIKSSLQLGALPDAQGVSVISYK